MPREMPFLERQVIFPENENIYSCEAVTSEEIVNLVF